MHLINTYFPELNEIQKKQFAKLLEIFPEKNAEVNMVSRRDIDELELRHVLHSLGIAKYLNFLPGTQILDVGTGGGFPGIPLAILFPEVEVHMVDSIGKKIKMVNACISELGLNNASAEQIRAEKLKGSYDFVVSRAVTQMPIFAGWMRHKIKSEHRHEKKNGILYLKGGELGEELKSFSKAEQISLKTYFAEDFFETKKIVYLPWK